jgi:V-type H+-transporting ATPase subunit a
VYKWFVAKEKAIYNTMNYMRQGTTTYIGYFWSPSVAEDTIRQALRGYPSTDVQRFENHTIKPPTYIKVNEFTASFQEIVNTYGIPMFQEINPAIFAIVTFPFLFGVMFGDIGHGSLLLVFGAILCLVNDKLKNTPVEAIGMIRYLVLLMGFFATFNGFIYNEFFAIPTSMLGTSCYSLEPMVLAVTNDTDVHDPKVFGYPRLNGDDPLKCVYPFGIDPVWFVSDQFLAFTNNFKMKTAVIFAILQMSLGIILKGANAIYFKQPLDFIFEFIPQILLLLVLFGWMDALIIGKWLMPKSVDANFLPGTADFN